MHATRNVRLVLALAALVLLAVSLGACPAPRGPQGPPPEYEQPAAPSWLLEAGTGSDAGAGEAGAAAPLPSPPAG